MATPHVVAGQGFSSNMYNSIVDRLDALDGGAVGGGQIATTATGPLNQAAADALLAPGETLFELDASGNIINEWVKTSA